MSESFYFPTHVGLLKPEHFQKIGPALWEFLWLISKVTKEIRDNGETIGIVLGGRSVKNSEIAAELGISLRTTERNIARLKQHNYINTKRTPYGNIFHVRNSKKFYKNRTAKNGGATKTEPPNMVERTVESGGTNKIKKDKENIYMDLKIHGDSFLKIYNNQFVQKFDKQHMKVTQEKVPFIQEQVNKMKSKVDIEEFGIITQMHFDNLPASNDGNFLAFIQAFPRYLKELKTDDINWD